MNEETTACTLCGKQTRMMGTKLCDRCWEIKSRIKSDPELALQILTELNKTPLPPRRPATKVEVEAMQSICNMQDKLQEAQNVIRVLLAEATYLSERAKHRAIEFLK